MNEFRFNGIAIEKPELLESDKGNKYCYLLMNVKRNYQTLDGKESYDSFKMTCFKDTALKVNDEVGANTPLIVKGHLQQNIYNNKEGKEIISNPELILDRFERI